MHKNTKLLISILLLTSFAFFCRGASLGMMPFGDHQNYHDASEVDSSCCGVNQTRGTVAEHHLVDFTLPNDVDFGFVVSFGLVALFFAVLKRRDFSKSVSLSSYVRRIYIRYGSFRVFELLCKLFRVGILHPKII